MKILLHYRIYVEINKCIIRFLIKKKQYNMFLGIINVLSYLYRLKCTTASSQPLLYLQDEIVGTAVSVSPFLAPVIFFPKIN